MDPVDLRILGALDRDARKSFTRIASDLGISSRLVQRRVTSMIKSGFIRDFSVEFDMFLLGLGEAVCDAYLQAGASVEEVRNNLLKISTVSRIITLIGGTLVIHITYQDRTELEQTLAQIASTHGVDDIRYEVAPQSRAAHVRLSRSDWQIIRALDHQARQEFASIAETVKLSSKTVKRRVEWLMKEGAINVGVDVDVSKARDLFLYILVIQLTRAASKDAVLRASRKRIATIWRELRSINPFSITLSLYAENMGSLERDVEVARRIEGVTGVSVAFITAEQRNDLRLDASIAQVATTRG